MSADLSTREAKGARAESLMQHPAFSDAVVALEEVITEQWRRATTPDIAWQARLQLRALNEMLGYLDAAIKDGRTASEIRDEAPSFNAASQEDRVRAYREAARASYALFDTPPDPEGPEAPPEELIDAGTADA